MESLKNQCKISNPLLGEHLQIDFDIFMEGKVMDLWTASPTAGKIKAHTYFYGDDGNWGDELLHTFEYPLKLSNQGNAVLEEKALIPFYNSQRADNSKFILDEDKNGRDEVYAVFYLTMTFEIDGMEVDTVITDLARTNTLKKNL